MFQIVCTIYLVQLIKLKLVQRLRPLFSGGSRGWILRGKPLRGLGGLEYPPGTIRRVRGLPSPWKLKKKITFQNSVYSRFWLRIYHYFIIKFPFKTLPKHFLEKNHIDLYRIERPTHL